MCLIQVCPFTLPPTDPPSTVVLLCSPCFPFQRAPEQARSGTYRRVPVSAGPARIRAVFFGASPAQLSGRDCVSLCVCVFLCCECMRVTHHGILSLLHDLLHFIPSFHVFVSVVAASESWRLKRKEIQKHMKPFCRLRRDIFERTQQHFFNLCLRQQNKCLEAETQSSMLSDAKYPRQAWFWQYRVMSSVLQNSNAAKSTLVIIFFRFQMGSVCLGRSCSLSLLNISLWT